MYVCIRMGFLGGFFLLVFGFCMELVWSLRRETDGGRCFPVCPLRRPRMRPGGWARKR